MINKKTTALICGAAGVCILATSAFASYRTASGYDSLKKSILATIDYTNCRVNGVMSMEFDGDEVMSAQLLHEIDLENNISHSSSTTQISGDIPHLNDTYNYNNNEYVRSASSDSDNNEYYVLEHPNAQYNLWNIPPNDRSTVDKILRFTELAADTVVGDLRNNFVCTDDSDDSVSYSITLSSVQIPEIINAGLSMIFSMENNTYTESDSTPDTSLYYTHIMGNDPVLDNVAMNYTLNKDGSFRSGTIAVSFVGNNHTMTFNISCDISDVGTTSIPTPDELGFKIITPDYLYTYEADGTPVLQQQY